MCEAVGRDRSYGDDSRLSAWIYDLEKTTECSPSTRDLLPSGAVNSCKLRSTARLKNAVTDEMCKQYDWKRTVRPLELCDDADASECSQETTVTSKGAGRNLVRAAVPLLSAQSLSKHFETPDSDSVSTSEEKDSGLREWMGCMAPGVWLMMMLL